MWQRRNSACLCHELKLLSTIPNPVTFCATSNLIICVNYHNYISIDMVYDAIGNGIFSLSETSIFHMPRNCTRYTKER
jgi:hypothetical protein